MARCTTHTIAGSKSLGAGSGPPGASDYQTAAEAAAFAKPKRKKKERRLRARSTEPDNAVTQGGCEGEGVGREGVCGGGGEVMGMRSTG